MKNSQFGFSKKTFDYFKAASNDGYSKEWFEERRESYDQFVKAPMAQLIEMVQKSHAKKLSLIDISPKKVTRPVRTRSKVPGAPIVKDFSFFTLWEKNKSMFEWNPGIHFQVGHKPDDCMLGVGLYMMSSRQMHRLRDGFVKDFKLVDKLLSDKKLLKHFGEVSGEKFVRFPRGFDVDHPSAKYLWYKQFYLNRNFSKKETQAKDFFENVNEMIGVSLPFLQWVRKTVGVYGG